MHCNCCDKLLNDAEATAKFVDEDGTATRYVEMCKKCRSFLPPDVRYVLRKDLREEEYTEDLYDFDDPFDESWDDS